MTIEKLNIDGPCIINLDKINDERGFFARFFCHDELLKNGINFSLKQINTTFTKSKGTIRGFHFQYPPKAEDKIIRCFKGSIFDTIVDLRHNSKTYGKSISIVLNDSNKKMLYIPKGFAHAFQTLEENCELLYLHSEVYNPLFEGGIIYNDIDLNIDWPFPVSKISEKDLKNERFKNLKPFSI